MKKLIALFLLLPLLASAASFKTYTLTFTNTTANGDLVTVSGTTVRFTNAPLNSTAWITSGSSNVSATNFFTWMGANKSSLTIWDVTNNVVMFGGLDLVASLTTPTFGHLVTNGVTATNQNFIQYPFDGLPLAVAQEQADAIVNGLSNATVALPSSAPALANHVGLTNAQTLTRKTLTSPVITDPTNSGGLFTNVVRVDVTLLVAGEARIISGYISNMSAVQLTALTGSGVALTNGTVVNIAVTNAPHVYTTNLVALSGYIANIYGNAVTFTNFSAPGSASFSQQIGGTATNSAAVQYGRNGLAGGANDVTLGPLSQSYPMTGDAAGGNNVTLGSGEINQGRYNVLIGGNNGGIVGTNNIVIGGENTLSATSTRYTGNFGHGNDVSFDYSFTIGYGVTTEREREIRIGGADQHVVIKALTNSTAHSTTFKGTNHWAGDVSYTSATYTSLVNSPGNNLSSGITIGTNYIAELSGATDIANICSFPDRRVGYLFRAIFSGAITNTLVHNSGAEGTAALRINTTTGANVHMTNNPSWAVFLKRSGDWLLMEHSN